MEILLCRLVWAVQGRIFLTTTMATNGIGSIGNNGEKRAYNYTHILLALRRFAIESQIHVWYGLINCGLILGYSTFNWSTATAHICAVSAIALKCMRTASWYIAAAGLPELLIKLSRLWSNIFPMTAPEWSMIFQKPTVCRLWFRRSVITQIFWSIKRQMITNTNLDRKFLIRCLVSKRLL